MLIPSIDGRYVHMKNAEVRLATYSDGSVALVAEDVDEDGMPNVETFSVNLSAYAMVPPADHVYVKDYSEHEGLTAALAAVGLVEIVDPIRIGPFRQPGYLVKLSEALLAEAARS